MARCPGQDQRYWTPDDIFDLRCPYCGYEIEFWKDEPFRICKSCEREIRNPRINLGCAEWCQNADACLGRSTEGAVASPVVERIASALEHAVSDPLADLERARELCRSVDCRLAGFKGNPQIAKGLALIVGAGFSVDDCKLVFRSDWREFVENIIRLSDLEDDVRAGLVKSLKELIQDRLSTPESILIAELLS